MPIVSSQIAKIISGGKFIYEEHTDHIGIIHGRRARPEGTTQPEWDAELIIHAAELDIELPAIEASAEVDRAIVGKQQDAQYQTQAELDLLAISILMQIQDSLEFSQTLQWFRDFEVRAGANTNARAAYLGVARADYDLVATRYNQITGVATGLANDAARVWGIFDDSGSGW